MKLPKEYSNKEIDQKLQELLNELNLSQQVTTDDIKNVIYHEGDLKGSMKLIGAFCDYAKTKRQFDLVAETIQLA